MHKILLTLTLTISMTSLAQSAQAEPVEIMLSDRLDGDLDYYCFDISGSKADADTSRGLQTHTCYGYQGAMGIDQVFDSTQIADNLFYMPEFDVCATLNSYAPGALVALASCDGTETQAIMRSSTGQVSPIAAPDMCLTAGAETRRGRGGTSEHQIKSLTLETCSADLAAYQTWETRPAAN